MTELDDLGRKFSIVQRARILNRHGASYDRALRQRDRWDDRWIAALSKVWDAELRPEALDSLADAGRRAWGTDPEHLRKAFRPLRVLTAVGSAVKAVLGAGLPQFVEGALAIYMDLARDESEDAGQHTLDQLGLNETFKWTGVRDMPRDLFAVRGSKIIQSAYGMHVNRLRDIVIDATDPAKPKTQTQVRQAIRDEWANLKRYQVERIARTEVATVWDVATVNAQLANDVRWFDVSIAKGPSIGPPKSAPVCKQCLAAAAGGPYPLIELPRVPLHPNCRCVTIPSLSHDWLPPAEPWHGNDPPLPILPAQSP